VPDPEELFDTIAAQYTRRRGVTFGRVWHNDGLTADGKLFAILISDRLVVKVPAAQAAELIDAAEGVAFEPHPGRKLREWLVVRQFDAPTWQRLIADAHAYARQG
jgi:hypothetical protein